MAENPEYNISFEGVNFTEYIPHHTDNYSFNGYRFPNGHISFFRAKFGRGNVDFIRAEFGRGNIDFNCAEFNGGNVYFSNTNFGKGSVNFRGTNFGIGRVSFNGSNFGEGSVSFNGANFGEGGVYFVGAKFGKGDVYFAQASFGKAFFLNIDCKSVTRFSLQNSTVATSLDLAGSTFGCVVDLRLINTSNISLDGIKCKVNRKRSKKNFFFSKAVDHEDIARSRRLKEIAESNKNHDGALHFHALEMRAKRWMRFGKLASTLDLLFDVSCDYGQSILRPFLLLLLTVSTFCLTYCSIGINKIADSNSILKIFTYSLGNNPLFLTFSKGSKNEVLKLMFGDLAKPGWIDMVFITQNMISIILMFLIVLGLRNRFRI